MSSDFIGTCEEILATLRAAELQIGVLAATHLPYATAAEVHRRATRVQRELRAKAMLASSTLSDLGVRDDETDELLSMAARPSTTRQASQAATTHALDEVAVPLDDGPEGVADGSMPLNTDEEEHTDPRASERARVAARALEEPASEPLVEFEEVGEDDVTPPANVSVDALRQMAQERSGASDEPLVSFDDTAAIPADALADDEMERTSIGIDEPPPGEFDDEPDTQVRAEPEPQPVPEPEPEVEPMETFDLMPDTSGDGEDTLVADLDSLVALQDMLAEEENASIAHGQDIRPPPLMPDLARPRGGLHDEFVEIEPEEDGVTEVTQLAEADLEVLGFDEEDLSLSPATDEMPEVEIEPEAETPRPAPVRAATARPISSVREAGADAYKPRAAAIRIGSDGSGQVVGQEEDDVLALGEADEEYDDVGAGGFSLHVDDGDDDEYEYYDEDELSLEMVDPEPEPEPEPEMPAYTGPSQAQVDQMLKRALDAVARTEVDEAILLYSDVLDADPDHVDAHIGRGRLYLDLGDYSRAMSDFAVAEDLAPDSPEPQVAIGDLYFHRKDYRKAIEKFDEALTLAPNHAMAFCRRGISHYYRKNYREALADLNRAEKLDPDIPNVGTFVAMAKRRAR